MRSRARLASTLDEALDLLFVGGESGDEGNGEDINFNDLEDEQLFCDSEADETESRTTEAERRQVGPSAESVAKGTSFKRGRQTSQEDSSEDEADKEVRELNREPKPKKKKPTCQDRQKH